MSGAADSIWLLFCMVFTLGIRHGFDLDHLATIDSITRIIKDDDHLARWVGFLFSLGHGLVVITICVVIGSGMIQTHIPQWLESFGNWISIFFLWLFGLLTLRRSLRHSTHASIGLREFFFRKWFRGKYHPPMIILVGALFAFSFDTFTQIALFSISASVLAGYFLTILLGVVFMFGMMTSDGLNGFFVSKLIQSADKKSMILSRTFGILIASFSLILGILSLLNQLNR